MKNILIAVESCQRDKGLGLHDHTRKSWGKDLSDIADLRFFVGGERRDDLLPDEIWIMGKVVQRLAMKGRA